MISVAPLSGGRSAAAYYVDRGSGCAEHGPAGDLGYYLAGGAPVGRWLGAGATELGLVGRLDRAGEHALGQLLEGRLGDEVLARPVLRYDDEGRPVDVRRCGYDLTFSAPKSVSLLMGLGEPAVAAAVRAAHTAAITDAVGLLETLAARAARGHHGDGQRAQRIPTAGVIGAAFEHHTSRADDPQLHTHVVLVNLVRGVDGRWSALDSRALHRHATTASYLYQHRLRAELTRALGAGWGPVERGIAEVDGIPASVRRLFSTRRQQIETHLTQHPTTERATDPGASRPARGRRLAALAARVACLATRPVKTHRSAADLQDRWWAQARDAGFTPDDLQAVLHRVTAPAVPDLTGPGLERLAGRVLGELGATRERATFHGGGVLQQLCQHLPPGVDVPSATLLAATRQLLASPAVVPVVDPGGRAWTTPAMLAVEQHALTTAARTAAGVAPLPAERVIAALRGSGLRPDQAAAVTTLLTSGRAVQVLTGPAGSGKTAALRAATDAWTAAGIPVAGTAVAALTARGLHDATGAPAVSLARLTHDPERHLPAGGVLLVDEAGMVGTRALAQLLDLTRDRGCALVLVGDPAQLPELDAGGLFAALSQQPTAIPLEGHHRQRESWERDALTALRDGRVTAALDSYQAHGRLHLHRTSISIADALAVHYLQERRRADDPWQVLVLAATRRDVDTLNTLIRGRLTRRGELGSQALTVDTPDGRRDYRTGDQVLITRNDHARGLLNGTTATVTTLTPTGLRITTTDGDTHDLDHAWLRTGQLDHAYAMTLHKAQGRTVHTSLLLAGPTLGSEAGYVGLSRGTHANHLYLTHRQLPDPVDCFSAPRDQDPYQRQRARDTALRRREAQELAIHRHAEGRSR